MSPIILLVENTLYCGKLEQSDWEAISHSDAAITQSETHTNMVTIKTVD